MVRKKLRRFEENRECGIVLEPGMPMYESIAGKWNGVFFGRTNPITLELGCGRGEYSVGLARLFANRNFIGVDVKGARIWKGMRAALDDGLINVGFLRAQADHLQRFFQPGEISEIWVPFPDPRPRRSDERKRLISPKFLNIYRDIIIPGGTVRLKTDDAGLFDYALDVLGSIPWIRNLHYTVDLYRSPMAEEHFGIRTRYECQFLLEGKEIKYLIFSII